MLGVFSVAGFSSFYTWTIDFSESWGAIGLDDASSLFLRDGAGSIVIPVAHITNLSISCWIVPTMFKEAQVIPLLKKGSELDPVIIDLFAF